jgi:hypothetical protein
MISGWARFVVTAVVGMVLSSCATSQQWSEWKRHPTHFASGEHFAFSMRTSEDTKSVSRKDLEFAQAQNWWGTPITVAQSQVVER